MDVSHSGKFFIDVPDCVYFFVKFDSILETILKVDIHTKLTMGITKKQCKTYTNSSDKQSLKSSPPLHKCFQFSSEEVARETTLEGLTASSEHNASCFSLYISNK